jgi:hypothetical protein
MNNLKNKIIIDVGETSELMDIVRNFDLKLQLYDLVYEEEVMKVLKKYNKGKIKRINYVFWCNIEEEISKLKKDEDVTGVYIEYIDRGVGDWCDLDDLLRVKYPNMNNLSVSQNFGRDNLVGSECDLVIMNTMEVYDCNKEDIIYMKKIYDDSGYFCPDHLYLVVIKLCNQIQIIITDEDINY